MNYNNDKLKKLIFQGLLVQDSLIQLSKDSGVDTQITKSLAETEDVEQITFSPRVLADAQVMSVVYITFFALENSVRELIQDRLAEKFGAGWWTKCVPKTIQTNVQNLQIKEQKNKFHTSRSSALIGYTFFGDLAKIIITNWDSFSDLLPDQPWVSSRLNDLELSRNIIMHTGVLADEEVDRIKSIARDWIRQVG